MRLLPAISLPMAEASAVQGHAGRTHRILLLTGAGVLLAACQGELTIPDKVLEPVQTAIAQPQPFAPTIALTGTIAARIESDLSFRVAGRIEQRSVDVGDRVVPGQVLAQLDTEEQEADVEAAKATLTAAEATWHQATTNFDRQSQLLRGGFTTKSVFDAANETLRTAEGSVQAAKADLATAEDQFGYTVLRADAAGIITARNVEAGQVVDAAQTVFTLAQDGGRDALFDVYEAVFAQSPPETGIDVRLVSDARVTVKGTIREIAPTFDETNGTVRVKVGLNNAPSAMTLGAAVVGAANARYREAVRLPWTALASDAGRPSVFVVDPSSKAVSKRAVVIDRYLTGEIVVSEGLAAGERVVTAGGQLLYDGQVVRIAEGEAK